MTIMEKESVLIERRFFDSDGNKIDPNNVYFRGNGIPYYLGENDVMTRKPLAEEIIEYEIFDGLSSSEDIPS